MKIKEAFSEFILSRKLSGSASKTVRNYEDFNAPFLHLYGGIDVEKLTQEHITGYLMDIMEQPTSKATKSTYIRHLRVFLRYMEQNSDVQYDILKIKVPKMPKRNVQIYSPKEIQSIFESVQTNTYWLTLRNRTIIALMYDSGLRQSEVCNLQRANIYWDTCRITIRGKGDKERTVPIGNLTKQYLRAYLKYCPYEHANVFVSKTGEPMTCNAVKLFVTKLSNHLPFSFSSHKLRHNYATNYCLDQYEQYKQVDIYRLMYLMGHEDIETTRRYLHFAYELIAGDNSVSHLDKII